MKHSLFPHQQAQQASTWDLPYVEDNRPKDNKSTNAFNRRSDWKYEPPEVEEEVLPPTAEELEAIRQAAREEGLEQGKKEGYQAGLEQGLEEGKQQGLDEGHAEGLEKGLAEGQEEIAQQISQWSALTQQLHHPAAMVEQQLQQELVRLAAELSRAVIGVEINTDPQVILQTLQQALKVLPIQERRIQIHLNPEDIALIKTRFDDAQIEKQGWVLIDSPQLTRGGFEITTESNAIDQTLERRCREVIDAFLLEQGLAQVQSAKGL
jgi:flagellar assembly protein FliH